MSAGRSRARVTWLCSLALASALLACATPKSTPRPPTGDELLAAGDPRAAAAAYKREGKVAPDAATRARARLLRAVSLLASQDPLLEQEGLAMLRSLEDDASAGVWTHVARAVSAEHARSEVLRRTIMRAGADVEELRTRLELCEEALADATAKGTALEEQRAALEEEVGAAQRRLRELEGELAARAERLHQLEEELSALKDIDMQREP